MPSRGLAVSSSSIIVRAVPGGLGPSWAMTYYALWTSQAIALATACHQSFHPPRRAACPDFGPKRCNIANGTASALRRSHSKATLGYVV